MVWWMPGLAIWLLVATAAAWWLRHISVREKGNIWGNGGLIDFSPDYDVLLGFLWLIIFPGIIQIALYDFVLAPLFRQLLRFSPRICWRKFQLWRGGRRVRAKNKVSTDSFDECTRSIQSLITKMESRIKALMVDRAILEGLKTPRKALLEKVEADIKHLRQRIADQQLQLQKIEAAKLEHLELFRPSDLIMNDVLNADELLEISDEVAREIDDKLTATKAARAKVCGEQH